MDFKYYTLQIHYGASLKPTVMEFKDCTPQGKDEKEWRKEMRRALFTTGFEVETTTGIHGPTVEFISPFRIHQIFLIPQDKQYSI